MFMKHYKNWDRFLIFILTLFVIYVIRLKRQLKYTIATWSIKFFVFKARILCRDLLT